MRDCAFIASALAKGEGDTLSESADFNRDGKVNIRDAAAIAAALAKGELKSEQNVISSLNHAATIATVAGSFAPQGFSGRFILLLKV